MCDSPTKKTTSGKKQHTHRIELSAENARWKTAAAVATWQEHHHHQQEPKQTVSQTKPGGGLAAPTLQPPCARAWG